MAGGLTPFGKELRKLRIDSDETLKEMAEKLGYTPSYLSAIECGKRDVTRGVLSRLINAYTLDQEEYDRFQEAYKATLKEVHISIEGVSEELRNLALLFENRFIYLSSRAVAKIEDILLEEMQR